MFDLWPFSSSFLLAIYSENAAQKCSTELCKSHKKTLVMEFLFKSRRMQLDWEKTSSKVLSREICEMFLSRLFSRSTFGECFCFGSCPCGALSKQYVFVSPNKDPLQVVRAILWNSFLKKSRNIPQKIKYNYWSGVPTFSLTFSVFSGQAFCRAHANVFWSWDAFLVYDVVQSFGTCY